MIDYSIVTLVGKHKTYCIDLFVEHISKVEPAPKEIVVSSIPEIFELFPGTINGVKVVNITGEYDAGSDRIVNTTSAREALRQHLIKQGYDWSLWLDNDILVPKNIVERAESFLDNNEDVLMIHSYHPARQKNESIRHGMGSCFVNKKLLNLFPFIYIELNGRQWGDDQIWLNVTQRGQISLRYKVKAGCLFDVAHFIEDGTIRYFEEEQKKEFI